MLSAQVTDQFCVVYLPDLGEITFEKAKDHCERPDNVRLSDEPIQATGNKKETHNKKTSKDKQDEKDHTEKPGQKSPASTSPERDAYAPVNGVDDGPILGRHHRQESIQQVQKRLGSQET